MTEELFSNARPVFSVDGEDISDLARDVIYLSVTENVDGLKSLQARFVAIGPVIGRDTESLLYLDGRSVDFGKNLKVTIGPLSRQRFIFDGFISALEIQFDEAQEPEFCLKAEDRLMDLRMTRRSRTFEEMTDAQIVQDIANEHGLEPRVDAQGPSYNQIQQCNMSDLAFLRDRARLLQAEVWVDDQSLNFFTRDKRQGTSLTLIRGTDLINVRASADLAHQRTEVHVNGYDADNVEAIDESAGEQAISSEVVGGRTGISILKKSFGERVSNRVMEVPLNSDEATNWAEAEMRRRARRFVTVNAVARGMPDLMVGSVLNLEQLGEPFNGDGYYVTKVQHTFNLNEGHRTSFEAERATIN
jgi:phage protein D